jgi:hypothetical protein
MATFNGVDIFGLHVRMTPRPLQKARQDNHYPGTTGIHRVDLGGVGGVVAVTGFLLAPTAYALGAVEAPFFQFQQDGGAYVLVDTIGRIWPNAILESYDPAEEVVVGIDETGTGWGRFYHALFRILQ